MDSGIECTLTAPEDRPKIMLPFPSDRQIQRCHQSFGQKEYV